MLVAVFALILAMALGINAFAERDQVGDLNRDGVKDENDAIYLLNHYIFGGDYEIDQPSDYNGDGKVDEDDAIYLLNNIIFGDYKDLFHICEYPEKWELVKTVEPTCKDGGYTIVKCKCGKEATILPTEKTDAHSFDWEKADLTHQATCLENGYITATCTVCGETETQQQAATGKHNWKKGNCEVGDMCTACGTQLPASGHKYPETPTFTQPATCKGGYEEYKCQNEGCESSYRNDLKPTDHRFAENAWQLVGERATEIECKYVYVESAKCEDCGETFERTTGEVIKHTETTSVTLATCVNPGQKIRSCSVCKAVIETTEMPVNKWAHDFDEGTTVGSVTTFKCQNKGCTKEKTTVKATEDGKVDLKDAEEVELNNGAAIIPDENIKEELGGKDVSVSIGEVKAEDLAGLKEEDKEKLKELGDAPVFDLNLTVGGEKVTNFGENSMMTVRLPYTLAEGDDPDCIIIWYIGDEGNIEYFEAKYVDGYAVFETNHFSYYTVTRMTPAQRCEYYGKHNYQTTVVPATCVTGGYTLEICTRCGKKNVTNETEALGHNWETTEKAPTCTEAGQKIYKCKACEISYAEVTSAIGHSIKEATKEYVAPSCTAKGVKVYRCENKDCSFSYTEEIAQIDHEYETEEVEADCQNGGYKNHKCKHCKHEYKSDQKKAKGHKYGVHGKCEHCNTECVHEYKYGVCTSCQKQKEKPKPEECKHNYHEDSRVEATCTTAGKIVYKCKKCDDVNEKEIPALGHDHAEAETIKPTCTTAGKIVYKCNKCDDQIETVIPMLGHNYVEGKCDVCGEECKHEYKDGICVICKQEDPNYVAPDCKEHKFSYTYEFVNKDIPVCSFGVYITETCENCGFSESFITYDCFTWLVEVDLSGYDHCGKHNFSYYRCACGQKTDWADEGSINLNVELEGMPEGVMGYGCKDCDMTALISTSQEKGTCTESITGTYKFYCKSELIHTMTVSYFEYGHEPDADTMKFQFVKDENCENGVIVIGTCMECGEKIELLVYTHLELIYERIEFSEYGACAQHYIQRYACPCGEYDNMFIRNIDSIPSVDPDCTTYHCGDCGLNIDVVDKYGKPNEKCEVECTTTYTITINKKEIKTFSVESTEIKHSYVESIKLNNGKDCSEGITVEYTCSVCGHHYAEGYEGHLSEETKLDLSKYDVCENHIIWVYQCKLCGYVESIWSEDLAGEGTDDGVVWFCPEEKCGIRIIERQIVGEKNENCWAPVTFPTILYVGDTEILSVTMHGGTILHEYEETFELIGTTCEEGIRIIRTCKDCGDKETSESKGHYYEDFYLSLAEYGCEHHAISGTKCAACNSAAYINIEGFVNKKNETGRSWYCKECNVTIDQIETVGEKDDKCRQPINTVYIVCVDGKEINTYTVSAMRTSHSYEYEYVALGKTCEDGVLRKRTCTVCGIIHEDTIYGHQYETTTIDLTEYGACQGHLVTTQKCTLCNSFNHISFEKGKFYTESIEGGHRTYCKSCAVELIALETYGEKDENCRIEIITNYSLRFDGKEILSGTGRGYKLQHDYDYKYDFLGKTCEDGVVISGICKVCKETTEHTSYGHQYQSVDIDLSEYGACKGHTLDVRRCSICNAYSSIYVNGDVNMYVENSNDVRRTFCKECNLELYREASYGEKDEKCQIPVIYTYRLCFDGKGLITGNTTSYRTEHDMEYSVKFNDEKLGCEGGVVITEKCRDCGTEGQREINYHETFIEEKYEFADYGHKCETGYVSFRSCACGKQKNFSINVSGFSHSGGKGETIDGVWHDKYSYVCDKCQYTVAFDNYHIKDENCNSTGYQTATFGGQTVYNVYDSGKSHNNAEKEIPEETYTGNNGDGTVTKYSAFEIYCPDCKASIEKRLTEETFDAEGNLLSIKYIYCHYVAVGEDGDTIAVIYRTEFREYLIVETLNGKQTLTRAEVYTNYNEDGTTNVERYDYEYDKDSFCSYTVTHTDFNGNTNTERVEGRHPSTTSKYVLNANSKTCIDGLDRIRYCTLCGVEMGRTENARVGSHYLTNSDIYVTETINLAQYGAVCEAYAKVYACPCGERKNVEVDTKCDYTSRGYGKNDENGIMHHYNVYFCAVTDPVPCGFKWVREEWNTIDENCNEIRNYTYYFGVNETNDGYQYSYTISYATGNKRHSELKTDETITDKLYSSKTYCIKCGMTERTEVVENCIKTFIEYRYHSNGALYSINTNRYLAIDNGEYWYTLERKYEYYNENGELYSWNQTEYTYPNAANGDYCTVIRTERDMSGNENVYEEENHQWSWNGIYCTPTYVRQTCTKCGETRQELMSNNGHQFDYDDKKKCFVCWACGLESASSGNGQVGFEDKTLELGNGTKYVVGWYNNYGSEYVWSVELINITNGEMHFLDKIAPEMINEYTIGLDAMAIREAAKALGIADCGYMIRLAFVPADGNGELDYAITLDPHVYVEESCVVPEDGCLNKGEYIWTYKCALCSNTYTESAMGHYYSTNVHRNDISVSDDGTLTLTTTYTATCERCKQTRIETYIYVYASNGQILKRSYHGGDGVPFETTYSYDYVNGIMTTITTSNNEIITEKYDMINDRQVYRKMQWAEGCYEENVYDYENDLHTFTRESTVEHIIKRVRIRKLSTDEEISENVIYADGRTESVEYIYINGNRYIANSMVEYSDKSWEKEVGALDEENGVYVTTRTSSNNEIWVWKRDLITGELVYEEYTNADGNKQITTIEIDNEKGTRTSTTVHSNGSKFINVSSLKDGRTLSSEHIYSETSWNKTVYEYDDEKGIRTQNTTYSDGGTTIAVYDMINYREISYEHRNGNSWHKSTFTYDDVNGTRTENFVDSEKTTTVSVHSWPECRLISSETTYVNGRTSRTEAIVDENAGTTTETTTTSYGYKRIYVYETKTGRTISDAVWEENGSYSERRYTFIDDNRTYCSYAENRDAENNVYVTTYIYYDNREYLSSIRNTYADGSTYEADRSYDFDKDICVEIVTSGEFTSEKRYKISTWEEIV